MFSLAILIGIYSYLIFALGLLGLLYKNNIIFTTLFFFSGIFIWKQNGIINTLGEIRRLNIFTKNKFLIILGLFFLFQAIINLIGVFAPELGFDALWYHLTLPKIYLIYHRIVHIPGSLLYYSDIPRLTEMIYTSALTFGNETIPKSIHFTFGILSSIAIYRISRKFFDQKISLISAVIFYSNLVFAWESTTANIDLARTFFEVMALWGFMNWWDKGERKWLIESSVMMGLAISVKILSVGSVFIFLALIIYKLVKNRSRVSFLFTNLFTYVFISILISLPWFVFSFINTGNPFYPFFTNIYKVEFHQNLLNPTQILTEFWNLFTRSADPISPLYIIFFPVVIVLFKKLKKGIKIISLYSLLALVVWYLTPRTGGGRFILPYLPAFSIVAAGVIAVLEKESKIFRKASYYFIIFVFLISLLYRSFASFKYIQVVFGMETKSQFLSNNLNFSFGDFYDTDNYFKDNIKKEDKVILYGFHNLYYVDFPFVDSSWVTKGEKFNYIAVQNSKLPERFSYWKLVYENRKTNVKVYSMGGQMWVY